MNWYRNNWYYVGGIIFVALAIGMSLFGEHIDPVRRIMIVGYMGLLIHQSEEYVLPGGFPMVWNIVQSGERKIYDRYPMNKKTSFVCNVCIMYPLYIAGIIFSDCYIWGLMLMYFSMTQIIIHGIIFNVKMKRLYNPGVAAVLLLPVSFCSLMLPIKLLADRNSKYVWPQEECEKFHVMNKMKRL